MITSVLTAVVFKEYCRCPSCLLMCLILPNKLIAKEMCLQKIWSDSFFKFQSEYGTNGKVEVRTPELKCQHFRCLDRYVFADFGHL